MADRNFLKLIPPPRLIPVSLRYFVLFANDPFLGLIGLNFLLFISWLLVSSDHRQFEPMFIGVAVFVSYLIIRGIVLGLGRCYYFINGKVTSGVIIDEKSRHIYGKPGYNVTELTFEYIVNLQKYKLTRVFAVEWIDLLKEDKIIPILYIEKTPEKGMLVDDLHARIVIDDFGSFCLKVPFLGYLYILLDILLLFVFITGLFYLMKYYY